MAKQLVIVESPTKAKTIERYLGKDYDVQSSFGHIRDLPKKNLSIDVDNDFEPTYQISSDKTKVVSDLKKASKSADKVWLASDEDREGEAIAWHLSQVLNLDPNKTNRIVFHEITKPAIDYAIKNPRQIDINLVDAQQARRVLDRLVGYELSPVLWRKVSPGLSAGRVQSVAVRLIVERENEINNFIPESRYRVTSIFKVPNSELPAELNVRFKDIKNVRAFLEDCTSATMEVASITKKDGKRSPSAPFITSSLQQEAARQLGYSVRQTMTVAQRLYESGHITYMRTDSTNLSAVALAEIKKYIVSSYGDTYYNAQTYKTKQSNAQEAHEAIRPTDVAKLSMGDDEGQKKLYNLIWRRTLASQMSDAKIAKTEIEVSISTRKELFIAKGEIVTFDGFFKVYGRTGEDTLLPELKKSEKLIPTEITAKETFSKPPARYSEASLVRKLEELGIGRPSTYAPTISTIQTRKYVEKKDVEGKLREVRYLALKDGKIQERIEQESYASDKAKLTPTPLAEITNAFLTKYFTPIVDYDFTAKAEKDLDNIAIGGEKWRNMIKNFYKDFHVLVDKASEISKKESTQTRLIGTDPSNNRPIYARFGRYGPMLQRGEAEDEEKPTFASLPANTTINSITLDEALEMFKLPRVVGKTGDGKEIMANIGRYGPYIQVDRTFVSIKDADPFTITEKEALKLYKDKVEQVANKYINELPGNIKVANGPYGPYVTNGKRNVKIPDSMDANAITEKEAKELLKQPPEEDHSKNPRSKLLTLS